MIGIFKLYNSICVLYGDKNVLIKKLFSFFTEKPSINDSKDDLLYKKLKKTGGDLNQIYDLVAFRIMVPDERQCYQALGIVHRLWPPVPGRVKDYIAMPKPNGYRSLHTTVFGEKGVITEFQIRTAEMHEEAENGVAAHFLYKRARDKVLTAAELKKIINEIKWVNELNEWKEKITNSDVTVGAFKTEFFRDRIFAVTPKGEVIDLPAGSTPIDFAYRIHTSIGREAVMAKIDGKIAPLNSQLENGQVVEILRQKGKKPSEKWLQFVKTSMARDHIKQEVKKGNRFRNPG